MSIDDRLAAAMAREDLRRMSTPAVRQQINELNQALVTIDPSPKPTQPPVMSRRFTPESPEYAAMKERHR